MFEHWALSIEHCQWVVSKMLHAILNESPKCNLNNDDFVFLLRSNLSQMKINSQILGIDYNRLF